MEKTDYSTMEEILAGYSGEKKAEKTLNDISEFTRFIEGFFAALMEFINVIKDFFAA